MKSLLFLALLVLSPLSIAEQIPLEDFVRHGDYFDMKISPDGKHLLARARAEGIVGILFLEAETMKFVGGVRPFEGDQIHSAEWINNERVIYQYAEKQFGWLDRPVPTGEIFATNIDGSKAEMLYGYRAPEVTTSSRIKTKEVSRATPYIISLLEGDENHILIIEHPWTRMGKYMYDLRENMPVISKLNIYNGRKQKVENLGYPGAKVLATPDGRVNFITWKDPQNKVHSAYRQDADSPWIDIQTAFGTDLNLIPSAISKNNDKVFFQGPIGEHKLNTLYELDLNDNTFEPLFEDLKTDIIDWTLDQVTNQPVIAYSQPDKTHYHYADANNPRVKLHKMLVDAFDGQTVEITSQSTDGKKLLVHVRSDINPGEFYIFNSETMDARFLWANRSWIDPRHMQSKKPFSFTTEDGVNVHGYLTMPAKSEDGRKPPMLVMLHGGPHQTRDYWGFDSEVQLFANRGYAVLQVNFRGSGGYGEQFLELGYRQWGGTMINDIIDATNLMIEQGKVDGNRVCVYGASYGGYAALMSAVRAPDLFQCTVGYVGLYDLNYAYSDSDITMGLGGEAYLEEVISKDAALLHEFSPINHVNDIKANVMLLHGARDQRVSDINSKKMSAALKKAGKAVTYMNFSNSGHGVYDEGERKLLYQALLDFLQQNIGSAN